MLNRTTILLRAVGITFGYSRTIQCARSDPSELQIDCAGADLKLAARAAAMAEG